MIGLERWEGEGGNLGLKELSCPECGTGAQMMDSYDRELWPIGVPHINCMISAAIRMFTPDELDKILGQYES